MCLWEIYSQGNNLTVNTMVLNHIDSVLKYHLQGDGVEFSNGRFNNQQGIIQSPQIAVFNRNNYLSFPFETGIVMTTGNSQLAAGPYSQNTMTTNVISYHDQYINNAGLATDDINNCASIDFDFLAHADTFAFGYVFASNEYPNFVCSYYNDVFAFFLTGVDPVTGVNSTKNVATIPGTITAAQPNGIPVSINTVNGGATSSSSSVCYNGTYSQYYVSNDVGTGIGYKGRTTALYAEGKIKACETYHMHLGICNIGDNSYDSGVFLEEKSFESKLETKLLMRDEWCIHEDIKFSYASGLSDSSFLVTPNGDTLRNEPFVLYDVNEADSGYYRVYVHSALSCVDLWSSDSIKINISGYFQFEPACVYFGCFVHHRKLEIIKHYNISTYIHGCFKFFQVFHFHFNLLARIKSSCLSHSILDPAAGHDMVFLNQIGVKQSDAVIVTASDGYRILKKVSQSGYGFSCI